jgi:uncharacterized membrane protein YkoI
MFDTARKTAAIVAVLAAAALGGSALAGAATSGSSSSTTTAAAAAQRPNGGAAGGAQGGHVGANGKTETLLTGDTAAKVKAAALAKVAGTVERVETNVDGSAPYEAHITKSDGTDVEVQVDANFNVSAVNTMGHR